MSAAVPTAEPHRLPELVSRASQALAAATTAAEVLDARDTAALAYDAAKAAARFAKAKGAHDELIAAAHRAQADALEIEAQAKRRLADEYDAAQERGEVAGPGGSGANQHGANVPGRNVSTVADLGLTRKAVHEARQLRDAEAADPGVIRRTLDARLAAGQEPTKAAVREAVSNVVSLDGRRPADPDVEALERGAAAAEAAEAVEESPGVDLSSVEGRAHAFNGALSTLDYIHITGPEYWSVFNKDPAAETYRRWVASAHAKLTSIIRETEDVRKNKDDRKRSRVSGARKKGSADGV